MNCSCGCGRKALDAGVHNVTCRERIDRGMASAREAASRWDRHDPLLDELKVTEGCRKVLWPLRRKPCTTRELRQATVGGDGAIQRMWDLKQLGFVIERETINKKNYRYKLVSEPTGPTAPATEQPPADETQPAPTPLAPPSELVQPSRSTAPGGPFGVYDDEAA